MVSSSEADTWWVAPPAGTAQATLYGVQVAGSRGYTHHKAGQAAVDKHSGQAVPPGEGGREEGRSRQATTNAQAGGQGRRDEEGGRAGGRGADRGQQAGSRGKGRKGKEEEEEEDKEEGRQRPQADRPGQGPGEKSHPRRGYGPYGGDLSRVAARAQHDAAWWGLPSAGSIHRPAGEGPDGAWEGSPARRWRKGAGGARVAQQGRGVVCGGR